MITVFGWSLRAPSQTTRFVFFVGLSIALMVMDHRGQQLEKIRAALSVLAIPVHYVAAAPARIVNGIAEFFTGERALKESIERLRDQIKYDDVSDLVLPNGTAPTGTPFDISHGGAFTTTAIPLANA